jgi:lipopolysaccharide export system permease protein
VPYNALDPEAPGLKILDRYIFRELLTTFTIGVVTFTFVLLMSKILRLVELIVSKGVPMGVVLRVFLYYLPYSLVVTIPMATLLACLATYGRMAADNEITALKVTGLSLYRLVVPALIFGILAYAATTFITVNLFPFTNRAIKDLVYQLTRQQAAAGIQEGVFSSDFEGLTVYVHKVDPLTGALQGVFIVDEHAPNENKVIIAKEGRLFSDPERFHIFLKLQGGSIHIAPADSPGRYRVLNFSAYDQRLEIGHALAGPGDRPLGEQELTIGELRQRAAKLSSEGRNYRPPLVEMHRRIAIPVACLVLVLVGPPLGMRIRRGGRASSLIIGIVFAIGYYVLLVAGQGLGTQGRLPPFWAMWLPNIILAAVGGALLVTGAREGLWNGRPLGWLRPWRPAI